MSIFSAITGITSTIGKTIEKAVIVPTGNLIASGISKATGIKATPQTSDAFSPIYTNVLGSTALALPVAYAGGVSAVGKLALANPWTATKVVGGTALAGSILGGSSKAQEFTSSQIVNAPGALTNYGSNIGGFIENPNLQTGTKIAKENPLLSGLTAGGLALIVGKGVGNLVNAETTRQNTNALQDANKLIVSPPTPKDTTDYKAQQKLIEESTKSQIKILEAQTKQAQEISKLNSPAVVAPSPKVAPAGQAKTKKKKKAKKKTKKKTRRSKKKKKTTKKKKSKNIKRSKK